MNYIITKIAEKSLKDDEFILHNLALKTDRHRFVFRMYDDDRNLFYEGLSKINFSFTPLDDIGYAVGCTEIHYLENGKFKRL